MQGGFGDFPLDFEDAFAGGVGPVRVRAAEGEPWRDREQVFALVDDVF